MDYAVVTAETSPKHSPSAGRVGEILAKEVASQRDHLLLKVLRAGAWCLLKRLRSPSSWQAAFTAWNPKLRLSTTNLMKSSIARILMMKEARAADKKEVVRSQHPSSGAPLRQPPQATEPVHRAACPSAKLRGKTAPAVCVPALQLALQLFLELCLVQHYEPTCGEPVDAMDVHFKW